MRPPRDHGIQDQVSAPRSSPAPLAGPQESGRALESEKGACPPSFQLPVRPRGRDPGRACRPRGRARKRGRRKGEECLPPPGQLAGRGGRRRLGSGPRARQPQLSGRTRGGELPVPPALRRGGEESVASRPQTHTRSVGLLSCSLPSALTGPGCEGSSNFIGAGLEEAWGCWNGKVAIASTGDVCFGGVVGSRECKASLPRFRHAKGKMDSLAMIS